MPDVSKPGYSADDLWLRSTPGARQEMYGTTKPTDHRTGVRVGVFGSQLQCATCFTICTPRHETFVLTDKATGETSTVNGAWVGPPDDPHRHFFPFGTATRATETSDATVTADRPEPTEPKARPAELAGVPYSRSKPTRELRRLQQQRARAKARGEPITPDMFTSTKAYARWRKRYGRDGVVVAEPAPKPPKAKRLRFTSLRRARPAEEPQEPPYTETVPDWDSVDDELAEVAEVLAEAEASLAKLRALPELPELDGE